MLAWMCPVTRHVRKMEAENGVRNENEELASGQISPRLQCGVHVSIYLPLISGDLKIQKNETTCLIMGFSSQELGPIAPTSIFGNSFLK